MSKHVRCVQGILSVVILAAVVCVAAAEPAAKPAKPDKPRAVRDKAQPTEPIRVYVPYEKLKGVFETGKQGVFLPYDQFERLWRAAQGKPAAVGEAPAPYLISSAFFTGTVDSEIARMELTLVVDILKDGWIEVPIGLGDVAVSAVEAPKNKQTPLLRVVDGQYVLLTRGKGRQTLKIRFARQLATQPGLNILSFRTPPAAITTLELTIPDENMKVDVEPMLAASTEQVKAGAKKATRLQAFLGATGRVKLSWKPKTQAAEDLAPVVICEQLQHINVAEALISHNVTFRYDIRRRGVDAFTVQLPGDFRVTAVDGANISKWDIAAAGDGKSQTLSVKLFSPAKGDYTLTVRMELFIKDPKVSTPLSPIVTREVLRRTGLIAITHSPRRSVEVTDAKNLARVDAGKLPSGLARQSGVTAWRFITPDYSGQMAIDTVEPRITARHSWAVIVDDDRTELEGDLNYTVERAGLFKLSLNLPEPWEVVSVGPPSIVDDFQRTGKGAKRMLSVLLKKEITGNLRMKIQARLDRKAADEPVKFVLPKPDAKNLQLFSGDLTLLLAERLRAEVDKVDQLQSAPLNSVRHWSKTGKPRAMAFQFRSIDPSKPAGASFKIAVKPSQVSAVVHRLVTIESGSIVDQALIDYNVLYAPVDTLYVKMPAVLADADVQISGPDIKEKPRIDKLPPEQASDKPKDPKGTESADPNVTWAYYKVVLQSPVIGRYRLSVSSRRSFQAKPDGKPTEVAVDPILAAGKLSDQTGHIAVAKAETLAVGEPTMSNLLPADPTSAADVPIESFRKAAVLAFRYNAPPYELSLPVAVQKEAAVFTTIATGVAIEQILGRGKLNTSATYLLETSRGDRLEVKLPQGHTGLRVLLNGSNAPVEAGPNAETKVLRLPPSAGQVNKLVLELHYGVDIDSVRNLPAPSLPADIPVQQTFWRVVVPSEDVLLWYDDAFANIREGRSQVAQMAIGYPGRVKLQKAEQGRAFDFLRQGAPGKLDVITADTQVFTIALWVAILIVGVAALALSGYGRCVLLLLAVLAVYTIKLFAPLLAAQLVISGYTAGLIVLGLWVVHWLFKSLPRQVSRRQPAQPPRWNLPPRQTPAPQTAEAATGPADAATDAPQAGPEQE